MICRLCCLPFIARRLRLFLGIFWHEMDANLCSATRHGGFEFRDQFCAGRGIHRRHTEFVKSKLIQYRKAYSPKVNGWCRIELWWYDT
jgi:hypothetical protein